MSPGMALFGRCRAAVLRPGGLRRAHAQRARDDGVAGVAVALLLAYWHHASQASHPVLRLNLFRTRTFRVAVIGSFVTRLGAGGMPSFCRCCPGRSRYTPVQSGLLISRSSWPASAEVHHTAVLTRLGYRRVLGINTLLMGLSSGSSP